MKKASLKARGQNARGLNVLGLAIAAAMAGQVTTASADLGTEITDALKGGTAYGDFRLRYENVDQDNALKDADALTLRSRLGYKTGEVRGFSGVIEFEDSRNVLGMDEYNDTQGKNPDRSVIADPETTELDQMYLQYKTDMVTTKFGRQVLTLDNHRFVGHVGWRQDRQTFDAVSLNVTPMKDLSIQYAFIDQRNRILAEEADVNSKDHLLNVGYQTPFGKLSGYAYLLEVDQSTDNALDTYGVRFAGKKEVSSELSALYTVEYAMQDVEVGSAEADADYMNLEAGAVFKGVTAKLGYEVLGSDDGDYGFSTPLATLHKFNGWADQFLATPDEGLVDMSLSVSGMLAGVKLAAVYHEFEADDASDDVDDLGSELDLSVTKKFSDNYSGGIKYAAYSAGDSGAGKVDTDKAWLWVSAKF
ncbi:alginate export family protein [Litoribrevibacter euphylliae]|uniref:Alginate export family protein n=1 Tax=Litoribrevibacter euphylliae TaxID=1834034 RepID=A0ABV7HA47_9GAMM